MPAKISTRELLIIFQTIFVFLHNSTSYVSDIYVDIAKKRKRTQKITQIPFLFPEKEKFLKSFFKKDFKKFLKKFQKRF